LSLKAKFILLSKILLAFCGASLLALSAWVFAGWALGSVNHPDPTPSPTPTPPQIATPDTTKILHGIGRWQMAHVCPVAPNFAITNFHVVHDEDKVYPLMVSNDLGQESIFSVRYAYPWTDLVGGHLKSPVQFYPVSQETPVAGEPVWWVGYNFQSASSAFATQVFSGHISRLVAHHLIIDSPTVQGSSGSCVLNSHGYVIAIIEAIIVTNDNAKETAAIGVWGSTLDPMLHK